MAYPPHWSNNSCPSSLDMKNKAVDSASPKPESLQIILTDFHLSAGYNVSESMR